MTDHRLLVTGSNGLVGSEAVSYFDAQGWETHGIDNDMRIKFFGPDGDTAWNLRRLNASTRRFHQYDVDIRDRARVANIIKAVRPDLVIHCAAQPSHELARSIPFDDFEINAVGTLNILESVRNYCAESPVIFMSTNKVYGEAPNELPLIELATRWDYRDAADNHGINETCRIDRTMHSLFGASKLAADILVQEYGLYFGIPTVCLRGGCLTGPNHSGAELHGFLAYLVKICVENRRYRVFGYKGTQVRDNIHSLDVCQFFDQFYQNPRCGAIYNIGGGRSNSISIIEAFERMRGLLKQDCQFDYLEDNRVGDHIVYITDLRSIKSDYHKWDVTKTLDDIFKEIIDSCHRHQ